MLESQLVRSAWLLVLLAVVLGLALSIADSRVRIDIVAFPLIGLIAWNLLVYLALLVRGAAAAASGRRGKAGQQLDHGLGAVGLAAREPPHQGRRFLPSAARRGAASLFGRMVAHRTAHPRAARTTPVSFCGGGGGRRPGRRLLCARHRPGIPRRLGKHVSRARAGTQRRERTVRPGLAVTGIALPDSAAEIAALHWRGGAGGGPAAPWIHLMSVTAVLVGRHSAPRAGCIRRRQRVAPVPHGGVTRSRAALRAAVAGRKRCGFARSHHPGRSVRLSARELVAARRGTVVARSFRCRCAHRVCAARRVWRRGLAAAKTRRRRIAGPPAQPRCDSRSRKPRHGPRCDPPAHRAGGARSRDCWCWWTKHRSCSACAATARCSAVSRSAGRRGAILSRHMASRRARSILRRSRKAAAQCPPPKWTACAQPSRVSAHDRRAGAHQPRVAVAHERGQDDAGANLAAAGHRRGTRSSARDRDGRIARAHADRPGRSAGALGYAGIRRQCASVATPRTQRQPARLVPVPGLGSLRRSRILVQPAGFARGARVG